MSRRMPPHCNRTHRQSGPTSTEVNALMALHQAGQWVRLEAEARGMAARYPAHPSGWTFLGHALHGLGRLPEAVATLAHAVRLAPQDAGTHGNLGNALKALGRYAEAEASYRKALAIQPDLASAHNNLGNIFQILGRLTDAAASYRQALLIRPDYANAHSNLGNVLNSLGRPTEAEDSLRRALALQPEYANAHSNLGNVLTSIGCLAEAEACYRKALALQPDIAEARSNLLFSLNYLDRPAGLYRDEALEYGRLVSAKVRARFSAWSCTERPGRLRVGIVSGDLWRHPVGYFLEGVLAHLDPARIELFAYPTVAREDDLTARLRLRFAAWTPLFGLDDETAARRIHEDGVYVLIDLSGHTAHNRLPLFAWKPAPVQTTWLGYSASTGLAEMDYLIADAHVAPPEDEWQFTERVWRLPDTYLCLTPPDVAVEVGPLPALGSGRVTFGSFNNLSKMNDAAVALWARALRSVPGSRLFLKAAQLGDPTIRDETARRFDACGIGPERLLLEGTTPRREDHLAAYNRMDIALDPFPYAGTTTSVESLWMGVPFLTRRGDRFVSHVGESIAHNAGLSDWIAADDDEYVAKAVAFASDLDRLAGLRAGLRQQVLASPLFDAPRFARHLEDALWGMWQQSGRGNNKASCMEAT